MDAVALGDAIAEGVGVVVGRVTGELAPLEPPQPVRKRQEAAPKSASCLPKRFKTFTFFSIGKGVSSRAFIGRDEN